MKMKTIRIKVESNNQEFDFTDFFKGSNTIISTSATLVQEQDGCYWHAFITFEPKNHYISPPAPVPENLVYKAFMIEINEYTAQNPPKTVRTTNAIRGYREHILEIKELNNFLRVQNIGKKTIKDDLDYFNGVLEIIKKYDSKKESK